MSKPPFGSMVYWRFKDTNKAWHFGYVSNVDAHNLIRMGVFNGDTVQGIIVDFLDIEWKLCGSQ